MVPEKRLTVAQVAAQMACSSRIVYGLVNEGKLPAIKFGKSIRIRPEDLRKYEETNAWVDAEQIPQNSH